MFCARCYTRNIPQQLMPMFLCCQIFCHINYLLNPLCPLWDIRPLWHKCKPILTVALNPSCPYPTCADCLRAAGGQQTLSIVSLSNTIHTLCAACAECPVGTEPVVGFEYKWWNKMPDNMRSSVYSREYSDSVRSTGKGL